jgi:hypothetical protein
MMSRALWRMEDERWKVLGNSQPSPWSLFRAEPPHHSHRGCILLAFEHSEQIGVEVRLIREIAPPFLPQQEAVQQPLFERQGCLLESLRDAAEKPSLIFQIFGPARNRPARDRALTRNPGSPPRRAALCAESVESLAHPAGLKYRAD